MTGVGFRLKLALSGDSIPCCIACRIGVETGNYAIKYANAFSLWQLQKLRLKDFDGYSHVMISGIA